MRLFRSRYFMQVSTASRKFHNGYITDTSPVLKNLNIPGMPLHAPPDSGHILHSCGVVVAFYAENGTVRMAESRRKVPRVSLGRRRNESGLFFSVRGWSRLYHYCRPCTASGSSPRWGSRPCSTRRTSARPYYRLPLARLWVIQSIWQFLVELSPPLLHADTWSASISSKL